MAKKLITTANLEDFIRKDLGKLYVTPERVITAGAKDELRNRGVQVVYGPEPAPLQPLSAPERISRAAALIVSILRDRYGLEDESQIQALAVKILKVVKDNL